MRRALTLLIACAALVVAGAPPVASDPPLLVLAEGSAVAFAVRPTYDAGGANPLHLYIGYADANVTEADADGQASWYNLGLAETAAFRPPEKCTPDENLEATIGEEGTLQDVQRYLDETIRRTAEAIAAGERPPTPTVPGPRHACTERFPGFAQSRFPETSTIDRESHDTLVGKPSEAAACRDDPESSHCNAYEQHWPAFHANVRKFVRDGAFGAAAGPGAQTSEALLLGAGDGTVVSIGVARTEARARVIGKRIEIEAVSTLDDVCIVRGDECTIRIDRISQVARVVKTVGEKPETTARATVTGVRGAGVGEDVTARELLLDQLALELGDENLRLYGVSKTGSCGSAEEGTLLADTGGVFLGGGGPPTTVDTSGIPEQPDETTIPGGGGGIMIGGACVRARISAERIPPVDFELDPGDVGVPPSTLTVPGLPGSQPRLGAVKPTFGPPRIVSRPVLRVIERRALAWRTAPWWAPTLGALALFALLIWRFPRWPVVGPAAASLDRFARRFLRG